jgi:hypothetical protein
MDAGASSSSASKRGKNLRFCPASSDLLYPRENKEHRKLEFYCKNCTHVELVDDLQVTRQQRESFSHHATSISLFSLLHMVIRTIVSM